MNNLVAAVLLRPVVYHFSPVRESLAFLYLLMIPQSILAIALNWFPSIRSPVESAATQVALVMVLDCDVRRQWALLPIFRRLLYY